MKKLTAAELFDLDDLEILKAEIADSCLFVNATGMGMKPLEGKTYIPDASYLRPDSIVADGCTTVGTAPQERRCRCKCMNGFGMMLFQGSAAFELWTGKPMPIEYMKETLGIKY